MNHARLNPYIKRRRATRRAPFLSSRFHPTRPQCRSPQRRGVDVTDDDVCYPGATFGLTSEYYAWYDTYLTPRHFRLVEGHAERSMNLCANHREKLSAILTDSWVLCQVRIPAPGSFSPADASLASPSHTVIHRLNAIRTLPWTQRAQCADNRGASIANHKRCGSSKRSRHGRI